MPHFDPVISRHFDCNWSPRSPDLVPPDYYGHIMGTIMGTLWGTFKARVYARNPRNVDDMQEAIRCEIANITTSDLRNAIHNLPTRLHAVLHQDGNVFEHLM